MTAASIKVKVVRKPTLKVKVLPRFPSSVTVQSPVVLTKTGGNYDISLDATLLESTLGGIYQPLDDTLTQLAGLCTTSGAFPIYNAITGQYVCSTVGGTGSLAKLIGAFDFEGDNAVGSTEALLASQGKIFGGSAAHPITTATPMVAISRYEAITSNTEGGQNAALWVESKGNNNSTAGNVSQVNALTINATQIGTGDVVASYSAAVQSGSVLSGTTHYAAYGNFAVAAATTAGAGAIAMNGVVRNYSGADVSYSAMVPGGTTAVQMGLFLQADGPNLHAAGVLLYNNNGGFDVGYAVWPSTVTTAAFISPGFKVDPTGNIVFTDSTKSVTWSSAAANAGIDFGAGSITRRSSDGHIRYISQNGTHEFLNGASSATVLAVGQAAQAGSLQLFGSSSGSAVIAPPAAAGTPTLTLPTTTDTLIGKATTDTLTNKTYDTAGTGNSFSINGLAATANTGTGAVVRATSPTLVTPALGAATATTLNGNTFTTGSYTITGTAGKTLTFSNTITLAGTDGTTMTFPGTSATIARTDAANTFTGHQTIEGVTSTGATGTGKFVFDTSPALVTPNLGTPSAVVLTNASGVAASLTAGNVTTNANLTGAITSVGNATSLGSFTSANLLGALTDETGTGAAVFGTTPTLATPVINGLPTGTGVATASTASTLVARDGSGNFSAGTITANTFSGAVSASTIVTSSTIIANGVATFQAGALYLGSSSQYAISVVNRTGDGVYWMGASHSATPDFIFSNAAGTSRLTLSDAGVLSLSATTTSSSPSTGALVVSGGAGVAGALNVGAAVATAKGTVAVVNGLNSNITTPANSYVRLTGPTGAFSLGGFTAGVDGYRLTVYNTVAQTMTIVNEDVSSTAANRIKTLTGGNVVLRATATSSATFIYDSTDSRWVLIATN